MKKSILLCLIILIVISCNKKTTSPAPSPTAVGTTCQTSVWKYEVLLSTPVQEGTFKVYYNDEYANVISDTSITTTWTKTLSTPFSSTPTFYVGVAIATNYLTHVPFGNNITNTVKLNIYKDGVIVQTTGNYLSFCFQNGGATCTTGSVNSKQIDYSCN